MIIRKLHDYLSVTPRLHGSYTTVTRRLHHGYTAVIPLLFESFLSYKSHNPFLHFMLLCINNLKSFSSFFLLFPILHPYTLNTSYLWMFSSSFAFLHPFLQFHLSHSSYLWGYLRGRRITGIFLGRMSDDDTHEIFSYTVYHCK